MKVPRWTALVGVALVAAMAATIAGAGGRTVRIAVVTDIGGVNDKGFNSLANQGRRRADTRNGVNTRIYITNAASERLPNLVAAARDGHGLVFGVGFLMFDSIGRVARQFPNVKFAGIDIPVEAVPENGGPNISNLRGLIFREHEAGYLVGYIAGLVLKQEGGRDVVSAVGANRVPAIVRFIAGYRAGVRRAHRRATVLVGYANDPTFANQPLCKEVALNQISRGSRVVFQVAGGCGLGALDAAKERRVWGIGVDADQGHFGRHMLTSATKKVDVAVDRTIAAFQRNPARFRGGIDFTFTVKNGGVGYGKVAARLKNRKAIIRKTERIKRLIASGRIKPPTQ
jgi:basic membrane protein A